MDEFKEVFSRARKFQEELDAMGVGMPVRKTTPSATIVNEPARTLLVMNGHGKDFKITVPPGAKLTFGPWSPPNGKERYNNSDTALAGTLRVYENHSAGASILAVFSGVTGYRDLSLEFSEKVIVEEGSVVWKNDKSGYYKEEKLKRDVDWEDEAKLLKDEF